MRRALFSILSLLLPAALERAAEATCQRPTDPGGYGGYDYSPATPVSFDGSLVRIWYVTTGPHAV